jgi:predicted nucleotidyltransferase
VTNSDTKREIIDAIARSYEKKCEEKIGKDLEALYLFGSYAFGKISLDIPDINYFLLLKEGVPPGVYLKNAEILREVCNEFKDVATVMPEFRPNRYIYPTMKGADFDVTLCTQYARMEDRHGPVPFGWGWVLEALLQTRKIVFGRDGLAEVHQPPPTKDYIKTFFPPTFSHIWLPLERAPLQYKLPEESHLLLHEAHKVAQMASIGFGVTIALNEKELEEKKWLEFVTDKDKLVQFYEERYDEASARNVGLMLEVRDNWLKHKNDPEMAINMYGAAIDICTRVKAKYGELVHG